MLHLHCPCSIHVYTSFTSIRLLTFKYVARLQSAIDGAMHVAGGMLHQITLIKYSSWSFTAVHCSVSLLLDLCTLLMWAGLQYF